MKRKGLYALVAGLAAIASVALMLVFVVVPGGTEGLKSFTALTREAAPAPGGPVEGIAVHGHWIIEVKNPDGTLAERREFDNALSPVSGGRTLALILARVNSVGGWRITLLPNPLSEGAFLNETSSRSEGILVESTSTITSPIYFKTLEVSVRSSGDVNKLVLSGTATAQTSGNIGRVKTHIYMLRATQPPSSDYTALSVNDLTETSLPSPVNLTGGQTVTVTVEIIFS